MNQSLFYYYEIVCTRTERGEKDNEMISISENCDLLQR